MNLQSLVVVALRLMALNFLFQSVIQFLMIIQMHKHLPPGYVSVASEFTVVGGMFLCTIILWRFAWPIAKLATRRIPQDISFGAVSLADCYSIAFMGIGLFYSISPLGRILHRTCYLVRNAAFSYKFSWVDELSNFSFVQDIVPFIAGIVLFLYGRKLALALARKHTAAAVENASESDI